MRAKSIHHLSCLRILTVCATGMSSALAAGPATPTPANSYLIHNLVSDLPSVADYQDPHLVNPWGLITTASSPFWLSNNGTGTSTVYSTTGTPSSLVVTVPAASSPTGGPVTGIIANTATGFPVATGKNASFIFCTADGTISGWNSSVNATVAVITVNNSAAGAAFTGCALGGTSAAPVIYAADFHNGVIDMFDANFNPITTAGAFVDPSIPAGYAPFNVASLAGNIYVAYAKQNASKTFDVAGAGNGYVDVFNGSGTLVTSLIAQGPLNSPWGMVIAPATFGQFGGALLVGNFGDGTVNAFDPVKGTKLGTLQDPTGHPLAIPGLWALLFGNGGKGGDTGTLYFTAGVPGPYGQAVDSHGLFGSIQAPPAFTSAGVVNGASFQAPLAPNTWASVIGGALATTSRSWAATDFSGANLPTVIDGVTVTVNGAAAPVSYIGPSQVDFLVPANATTGPAQVQVTNNDQISGAATVTLLPAAPAFFWLTGNKYIAATHADGALAGPTTLIAGETTPVMPGETIVLYGTGFGVTSPAAPNNATFVAPLSLATLPTITIGGTAATVTYGGLIEPGVYQINVVVPVTLPAGDAAVVATVGSQQSQANALISVL